MTAVRDLAARYRAPLAIGLSLGVLLIVCLHWWHAGYVIAQDDNPPIVTPGIWFAKTLSGWSTYNTYFGQIDGAFAFLPYMVLWWLADRVFGAGLGQVVMDFTVAAIAWGGAYRLVRTLGVSVAGATVGAWLYVLNPFTQIVFGNQLTEGIFFALLAWVGSWIVAAATGPARRRAARIWLTVIAFAALPTMGVTPVLVFQMASAFVVLVALSMILTADRRAFLSWALGAAASMVVASLWWVVPDVLSFVGAAVPHPTALSALDWTYVRSSLLNNMRFLYTWLWGLPEYYPVAPGYDANPFTYAAGFFVLALAAAGLIVLRGRDLLFCRFALAVALITMFVSKGTHGPLAWVNALFAAVPGAFLAYGDPGGLVALALLLLAAAGALAFDRIARVGRGGMFVAALVVIAISGVDLLNGSVFHSAVVGSDGTLVPSEYVAVPAYWRSAADYINEAPQAGGVLMLPPHLSPGYDVRYDFGYYGSDAVATNLIARRILYLDAGLTGGLSYVKHLESQSIADRLRDLLGSGSPLAVRMIRDLGIRYVVYRADIVHEQYGWHSQDELSALLGARAVQFGPLAVYDLGAPESPFALRRDWVAGSYGSADAGAIGELSALEEPLPRVDVAAIPRAFPGRPALVERSVAAAAGPAGPGNGAFGGTGAGVDRAVGLFAPGGVRNQIPVVVKDGPDRTLRMSLGGASALALITDIPILSIRPTAHPSGEALLAAHVLSIDDGRDLSLTEEVDNVDVRSVYADVVVPVPASPARSYELTVEGSRYQGVAERAGDAVVVRFRNVLLLPGATTVGLSGTKIDAHPPLSAASGPERSARSTYAFYFTSVHPAGLQVAIGIPPTAPVVGSIDVPLTGADYGSIEVLSGPTPLPALSAAIAFSSAGTTYRCPLVLYPGRGVEIDHALGSCLTTNLLPANVESARIHDLQIYGIAGLPDGGRLLMAARADAIARKTLGPPELRSEKRDARISYRMHWRVGRDAVRADIVTLRIDGCGPAGSAQTSTLQLDATAGRKRLVYRQPLFTTPDGAGQGAAVSMLQAFAKRSARLTGVTASCETDAAPGAPDPVAALSLGSPRGFSPVLIPTSSGHPLAVARGGVAARPLPASGAPLVVRFGDLPPETSVAAAGAPPRSAAASMTCGAPEIRCGGRLIRAAVPSGFVGLATFGQLYSPTWIGVEVGGGIRFPKHVRADGWQNAWFVADPGELFVFNLVDVVVFIGLLAGLAAIAWQLRSRES